jgi:hypothetical protein
MARNLARLALVSFLTTALGMAAALGRDERGERITGDDDPIIVPRSVAEDVVGIGFFDPETTGSIGTGVQAGGSATG